MIIIGVDHRKQEPKGRNITKNGPKKPIPRGNFSHFPHPPRSNSPKGLSMHVAHDCHGRWHRFDIALFGQDHAQALKQVARMENWSRGKPPTFPWSSISIKANLLDKPLYRTYQTTKAHVAGFDQGFF